MEKFLPWFTLKSVPGIGDFTFKLLIDHFGSPEAILGASKKKLFEVDGISYNLAEKISVQKTPGQAETELELVQKKKYRIVTLNDPDYPPLLLQLPDPPPFLYVFGSLAGSVNSIAVVGSRNASSYGVSNTKRLCFDLATRNITIISGMAKGIDTAAHRGAIEGRGKTIAVLGSGLERIYPRENRDLFFRIADNGAVVSEFSLFTEPVAYNFPRRNRIISGMALGTVVVEAAKRSGSLITARLAAEQNRDVFAVPGNIRSHMSKGTHYLIKQGAKLVETAEDILEEFVNITGTEKPVDNTVRNKSADIPLDLSAEEKSIFKVLSPYPLHIDDLVRKLSMATGKLLSILLQLELKGIVQQSPGKFFSLKG